MNMIMSTPNPKGEHRGRFALVIVGSGIAGASCALMAAELGLGPIALISKGSLSESNTHYAQGGIAGALNATDRAGLHARDTLIASSGSARKEAIRRLCSGGKAALEWLIAQGVPFDRNGQDWAFGLEAAHSCPRILHAGGDATGAAIADTLIERLHDKEITLFEHSMLVDLDVVRASVRGVYCLDAQETLFYLAADQVVLATGGAGQVYAYTTNPQVATGDGVACAFRAGAAIMDAEFYQFHPTALALGEQRFLLSEAVRGEGAVLRDKDGQRFMPELHDQAELAPRDIVARAIVRTMAAQQGQPVWLDATALDADFLLRRFPSISERLAAHGLSLGHDWLPVTPAAHYWMGGILTDTVGRTTLHGLYALGEVACTGVHGANRLASNSLLEGVVFARRLVDYLAHESLDSGVFPPRFAGVDETRYQVLPVLDLRTTSGNISPVSLSTLRQLMWDNVGLERNEEGLRSALATLHYWLQTSSFGQTRQAIEVRNQLDVATLMCEAALAREESRGAHFRSDYPQLDHRFDRRRAITHRYDATYAQGAIHGRCAAMMGTRSASSFPLAPR